MTEEAMIAALSDRQIDAAQANLRFGGDAKQYFVFLKAYAKDPGFAAFLTRMKAEDCSGAVNIGKDLLKMAANLGVMRICAALEGCLAWLCRDFIPPTEIQQILPREVQHLQNILSDITNCVD